MTPPDPLIRSGARSGHKREFAFILRSQADAGLTRTRSGNKSPLTPHVVASNGDESNILAILGSVTEYGGELGYNEVNAVKTGRKSPVLRPERTSPVELGNAVIPARMGRKEADSPGLGQNEVSLRRGGGKKVKRSVESSNSGSDKDSGRRGGKKVRRSVESLILGSESEDEAHVGPEDREKGLKSREARTGGTVSGSDDEPLIMLRNRNVGNRVKLDQGGGQRWDKSGNVDDVSMSLAIVTVDEENVIWLDGESEGKPVILGRRGRKKAEASLKVEPAKSGRKGGKSGKKSAVEVDMSQDQTMLGSDDEPLAAIFGRNGVNAGKSPHRGRKRVKKSAIDPGASPDLAVPGQNVEKSAVQANLEPDAVSSDGEIDVYAAKLTEPAIPATESLTRTDSDRQNEAHAAIKSPMAVDSQGKVGSSTRTGHMANGVTLQETPIRRFTRSLLNTPVHSPAKVHLVIREEGAGFETPIAVGNDNIENPASELKASVDKSGTCTVGAKTQRLDSNASGKLLIDGLPVILALEAFSDTRSRKSDHVLEKPNSKSNTSASKPPLIKQETAIVVSSSAKRDTGTVVRPVMRFTRSALKPPVVEDSSSPDSDEESDTSEETESGHKRSRKTLKKKMELKMSKKISLTKTPSNARDLFATGLLEGYPVKYICKGKTSLEGVIRGTAVLCYCPSCKGSNAFSAYNFEVHAGSNKRHPSDNIFLENGKNLHDVLKACTSVPLNMLEATIQSVIGPVPPKRPSICQKCGESFLTSHTGEHALLCDLCRNVKHLRTRASPSNGSQSIAKLSRPGSLPDPSYSASLNLSSQKKNTTGRVTKKDIGLHKLVFMDDILPEGTEVAYYHHGQRLLDGYIKDSGIFCLHCQAVVAPSSFEAHAGRASRRKPFHNIYTSNGVSLHELSVSLSKGRKLPNGENDDLCNKCNDGGDLLLCDLCPRAFHKGCVGLSEVPKGDWHCPPCRNMHEKEKYVANNDNAIAAGRVAGVDPIEQIIQRCIRIFTSPGADVGGCALCRLHDFSKATFDERTVLICDQCEKEYHVGCLRDHNMCDLKALPEDEWFCCADCSRIHIALQELLLHGKEFLKDSDADIIRKKHNEKGVSNDGHDGVDVRWRILSGRTPSDGSKLLLSETVSLFNEAFDPIVGAATGRDLIPFMVNGENMGDQDFGGMLCVVLTVNSSVVSAGLLRILGCDVAELPLVATSRESQGRGYFQSLFSCIERLLGSLKVKHFVLPAAEEALSIWTKKFGFTKIMPGQLAEYTKGAHPMIFQGTSMLHKPVPECRNA